MSQELISRRDAAAAGLKRFFTGKPCAHGHIAQRFVTSGACVTCAYPFARNKSQVNVYTQLLTTFQPPKLWVLKSLSPEELQELSDYLQVCADAFTEHKAATDYALSQDWQQAREFTRPKK